ncbi:MAG: NUDIX hydrolase [Candidatus Micrarchaeota archaeon]|nr:NUDIX hydrolase [Candidatus Micrarchaeota archaeon]
MPADYETARVAVDPVVFTVAGKELLVLLNTREKAPFAGRHELPGGLLLKGEEPEAELERKLRRLFNNRNVYFTQFRTFYESSRDPRMRTVSMGYLALVPQEMVSDRSVWFSASKLPPLAFDHAAIIGEARSYLKKNISALIARQLLPARFPLNQLQQVYEAIEGIRYDNRNFRKKMLHEGIVEATSELMSGSSHRPPRLYKFKAQVRKS